VRLYRRYLAVRPLDSDVTATLAVALYEDNQPVESIATFERAISLDSNQGIFATNVARYLLTKGQYANAEAFARRSIALNPRSGVAHETLGVALALQSQLRESEAFLQRSLELEPRSVSAAGHLRNVQAALAGQR
jgi:tetratricopeptide (TPR) repeat protein